VWSCNFNCGRNPCQGCGLRRMGGHDRTDLLLFGTGFAVKNVRLGVRSLRFNGPGRPEASSSGVTTASCGTSAYCRRRVVHRNAAAAARWNSGKRLRSREAAEGQKKSEPA
jgi:hypothetical protein